MHQIFQIIDERRGRYLHECMLTKQNLFKQQIICKYYAKNPTTIYDVALYFIK